VKSVCRKKARS